MSEAIAWLKEAEERLVEMDYLGIMPEPMPILSEDELKTTLLQFWTEGWSVGATYAWAIAAHQEINPFDIKKLFDQMDMQLVRSKG
jgi:hypothetical protein